MYLPPAAPPSRDLGTPCLLVPSAPVALAAYVFETCAPTLLELLLVGLCGGRLSLLGPLLRAGAVLPSGTMLEPVALRRPPGARGARRLKPGGSGWPDAVRGPDPEPPPPL